ncbi:MAG: glycosyltransferase family 2 protein [Proteobacteria bacterium]|nr:glycosyltransferase family 2 protein [Pseudomonadota bacterium]
MLAEAIGDYHRQTFRDRELLILHDGDDGRHRAIAALATPRPKAPIRIERAPPGLALGGLRTLAIERARGDWICQWDDDDRYHPARLQLQWDAAAAEGAAVNYLVDQLHWFRSDGVLCWDDWDREPYPMNVIQGTILARRDVMPPYPNLPAGEDTAQTYALLRASAENGFRVSRLRGAGWCYVYSYHGGNVWNAAHHKTISQVKHLPPARLLPKLPGLRQRLAEYDPPLPRLQMPVGREMRSMP